MLKVTITPLTKSAILDGASAASTTYYNSVTSEGFVDDLNAAFQNASFAANFALAVSPSLGTAYASLQTNMLAMSTASVTLADHVQTLISESNESLRTQMAWQVGADAVGLMGNAVGALAAIASLGAPRPVTLGLEVMSATLTFGGIALGGMALPSTSSFSGAVAALRASYDEFSNYGFDASSGWSSAQSGISNSLNVMSGLLASTDGSTLSSLQLNSLVDAAGRLNDSFGAMAMAAGAALRPMDITFDGASIGWSDAATATSIGTGSVGLDANGRTVVTGAAGGTTLSRFFDPSTGNALVETRVSNSGWTSNTVHGSLGLGSAVTSIYDESGALVRAMSVASDHSSVVTSFGLVNGASRQDILDSSGALTGSVIQRIDGSVSNIEYVSDGGAVRAYETDVDADGNVISQRTFYRDGSWYTVNADGSTRYEVSQGNAVLDGEIANNRQVNSFSDAEFNQYVSAIASTLATQLARILFSHNVGAALSVGALTGTGLQYAFGQAPTYVVAGHTLSENQAFLVNFGNMLAGSVGGLAGAELGEAFFKAVGLPKEIGALAGGVVGSSGAIALVRELETEFFGIQQVGQVASFGDTIARGGASAAGAFVGSELSSLVIGEGGVGSQVVGAVGSAVFGLLGSAIANGAFPIVGTFIGSFIGEFVGSLFGSLFDGAPSVGPNMSALMGYSAQERKFMLISLAADNGGDPETARTMANYEIDRENAILKLIGGTVAGSGDTGGGYSLRHLTGFFKNRFIYGPTSSMQNDYADTFDSAESAVGFSIMRTLRGTEISGGNEYLKLAVQRSKAVSLNDYIADLNAAYDYGIYASNSLAFEMSIAMSGNKDALKNWNAEISRAQALGLDDYSHGALVVAAATTVLSNAVKTVLVKGNVSGSDSIRAAAGSPFSVVLPTEVGIGDMWLSRSGGDLVMRFFVSGHVASLAGWYDGNSSLLQALLDGAGNGIGSSFLSGLASADAAVAAALDGTLEAQGGSRVDANIDVFGTGRGSQIIRDASGHLGFIQYDAAGTLTHRLWLVSGGDLAVLQSGMSIIGTSRRLLGADSDLLVRGSGGDIQVWEATATGAVIKSTGLSAIGASDRNFNVFDGQTLGVSGYRNTVYVAGSGVISLWGDNRVLGDGSANTIGGGSGADTIDGKGGADTLRGNGGDDSLTYDVADSVVDGGTGIDTLVLTGGTPITVDLSVAADQVIGGGIGTGFENVDASAATNNVSLTGDGNANVLHGGTIADNIDGQGGDDTIWYDALDVNVAGGAGIDTVVLTGGTPITVDLSVGADQVVGGGTATGFENVDASAATNNVSLIGDGNGNVLRGGTVADNIFGQDGDDTINYGVEDVTISGGSGIDTLVLTGGTPITVDLSSNADQVVGGGTATGFENVDGSGLANRVVIAGDSGSNILRGGEYADTIAGGAAGDRLYGNGGNDTITYDAADAVVDGGAGADTLVLNESVTRVVYLSNTSDQISGDAGFTTGFDLIDGTGSGAMLTLFGDGGSNRLTGGMGNDELEGGLGQADVIDGGGGYNYANFANSAAVSVNLATQQYSGGEAAGDTMINIQGLEGSLQGDTLIGDGNQNIIYGRNGDDFIDGGSGADQLYGQGDNDRILYDAADVKTDGGAGIDTLVLTGGSAISVDLSSSSDQVIGGGTTINFERVDATAVANNVSLTGDANANFLRGGTIADNINGQGGDDWIWYDVLDVNVAGGSGIDTLVLTGGAPVTVDLSVAGDQVIGGGTTTGFENVDASSATNNVSLTGDGNGNIMRGGSAADILMGGAGDDTITYGSEDFTVSGGSGVDTLVLAGGIPITVDLSNTSDQIAGGGIATGFESVDASAAQNNVWLGGDDGGNVLMGGSAGDTLVGRGGMDSLYGNAGADRLSYDGLDAVIDGGSGIDTLVLAGGTPITVDLSNTADQVAGGGTTIGFENVDASAATNNVSLAGDANANVLRGGAIADNIYGQGGDDTIWYDALDVNVAGGTGIDTLVLTGGTPITVDLSIAGDQVVGGGMATSFENVDASAATNNVSLSGDANANVLRGGTIADNLYGQGGNDTVAYDSSDVMADGGTGTDTLVLAESVSRTVNLANTSDQIAGDAGATKGFDLIDGSGSTAALTLFGDAGSNRLTGGAGNDEIEGGGGAADVLDGGGGYNYANFAHSTAVSVNLASKQYSGGEATGLTLLNIQGLEGSLYGDTLTGDADDNIIYGRAGNDVIDGGTGVDRLYGQGDDDRIVYDVADTVVDGGGGIDTLVLTGGTAIFADLSNASDQVVGGGTAVSFDNVDASAVTNNVTLSGDAGANSLTGGMGNDTLSGGTGADTLAGNHGNDRLSGGLGSDLYLFDRGGGADRIIENDATAGNADRLLFGATISYDQLWFSQRGHDLRISVIGTADSLAIDNWFVGTERHVETIEAAGRSLAHSNVVQLVNAMAAMTEPGAGETSLSSAAHAQLDGIIAANWHAAA